MPPENIEENLQFVTVHLAGVKHGAKWDQNHSIRGCVQDLLQVWGQRFGLLHIEATNLNNIGGIAPGSMGHLVAVRYEHSEPIPDIQYKSQRSNHFHDYQYSLYHLCSSRNLMTQSFAPSILTPLIYNYHEQFW